MVGMPPFYKKINEILKCALVGGLISIPLTIVYNIYHTSGESFTLGLVFFGGIVSGYLANETSLRASMAGFYAGLIGSLPAYILGISDITTSTTNTSSSIVLALFTILFTMVIFAMGGITGSIGGLFGGWLTKKFGKTGRSGTV
ncbi:DUF5518 domain-containing protein [Natrinema sp. JCM 9743]